jgi:hypothetical protein
MSADRQLDCLGFADSPQARCRRQRKHLSILRYRDKHRDSLSLGILTAYSLTHPSARMRLSGTSEPILGQLVWTRDFYAAVNEAAALEHGWARQMSGFLSCEPAHVFTKTMIWQERGQSQEGALQSLSVSESSHDTLHVSTRWKCTKERDLQLSLLSHYVTKTLTSSPCDVMKHLLGNGLHV